MHTKRIIPCLDVNGGRVVKGVNFVNLIDAGDPVEVAKVYDREGADELVFLDITASSDARKTVVDMVRRVAENVFIPFTVGGGIRTVDDFKEILREGADKVAVNSAAIMNPDLISQAADKFGIKKIALAGGVASNSALRASFEEACNEKGFELFRPSPLLCTDNGAMIACAGYYEFLKGVRSGEDLNAVPNLGLGER